MGKDIYSDQQYPGQGGNQANYVIDYLGDAPTLDQYAQKIKSTYFTDEQLGLSPVNYASQLPQHVAVYNGVFSDLDSSTDSNDVLSDMICELKLKGLYKMEKKDSKHRMGDLLIGAHTTYDRLRNPQDYSLPLTEIGHPTVDAMFDTLKSNAQQMGFYEWLDAIPEIPRLMMISSDPLMRMSGKRDSNIAPSMVVAFIKGVKYLDAVARKSYELVLGPRLTQNGKPFSTENMKTVHSGKGYAIWVAGGQPTTFYAGNHVKGQFHHSSFLAGGAVVCGGEIVAHDGKIKLLSAKTGHYKAQITDLVKAINLLAAGGVQPNSYRVLVWKYGQPVKPCPLASEVLKSPFQFESWGQGHVKPQDWNF